MIELVVIVLLLVALDIVALLCGADSIDPINSPEWEWRRNWPPVPQNVQESSDNSEISKGSSVA